MAATQARETRAVARFLDGVGQVVASAPKIKPGELVKELGQDSTVQFPGVVSKVLDGIRSGTSDEAKAGDLCGLALKTALDGVAHFEREHGFKPSPEMLEVAFSQGFAGGLPDTIDGRRLDSVTNFHHDQLALQPNRAITAILSTFVEAMPFAGVLPTDIGSNKALLGIVQHQAKSAFGEYAVDSSIDGVNAGGMFFDSERIVLLTANGGGASGSPLTATVGAKFTGFVPDAVAGANVALKLLRGRTALLVNGLVAAREVQATSGSGNNSIAGNVTIAGTDYALTGTVNSDNGAISVTASPALPANTTVHALVYIDYERQPEVIPEVGVEATMYELFARPSRGLMRISHDALGQMQNELSLDPMSEALLALRAQHALERHYRMLARLKMLAVNMAMTYDFDWVDQKSQKERAQVWRDFGSVLGTLSQQMANATNDHGITTLYVTGFLAKQFEALPADIWQSSGISERPGIYRMGRLFGKYDVYYTPKGVTENGATSQILCIGRSSQVARNPVITGTAIPAMFLPLGLNSDLKHAQAFYVRDFADINPHRQSAQGAALITVTNLI